MDRHSIGKTFSTAFLAAAMGTSAALAAEPTTVPAAATKPFADNDEALQKYLTDLAGANFVNIRRDNEQCTLSVHIKTAELARLLQKLDMTPKSIREEGMVIASRTPGVDDLDVEIQCTLQAAPRAGVPLLECLAGVSALFPQKGNTIWVNSFSVDVDHISWTLEGQCSNTQFASDLCAAMEKAPGFMAPKVTVQTEKDRAGTFSYRLTFLFQSVRK